SARLIRSSGTHSSRLTRVLAVPGARRRCLFSTLPCWTKADGAYLAAYLATRRDLCVHVRVRSPGADGGDDRGKVTLIKLLAGRRSGDDVCRCDRAAYAALLRALRSEARRIRICRGLTQKDDDAAIHAQLTDMDVGLSHRRL